MNWIITLTRNNLKLTQAAIASFRAQDIGDVAILVVDNDSVDSTVPWLNSQPDLFKILNRPQVGVAGGWNQALKWVFGGGAEYALVVNNDAVLRPDAYRWLVADGGGFVTCVGSDDPKKIEPAMIQSFEQTQYDLTLRDTQVLCYPPPTAPKRPHPDFSCFLIRRRVYETVGPFDEQFEGAYCEDSDYHLRMHRAGIRAECLDLPFYHIGAATVNNADDKERRRIQKQADRNRELFKARYGFAVGSEEYYKAFDSTAP